MIPFSPNQRIHVLYIGAALLLAFIDYRSHVVRRGGATLWEFLRHCFPRRIYAHPSARIDYMYFAANAFLQPLILGPIMISTAFMTDWTLNLLAVASGVPEGGVAVGVWATVLMTVGMLLATDFGFFCAHYLQHKVPLLWEFHKVHHSAEVLTPITVFRVHPIDNLVAATIVGLMSGVVYGAFKFTFVDLPGIYMVFGLNAGLFIFYVAGYNIRHSHIWLSYPPAISHVLISPAQHQIHHSLNPKHFDKNLGFILAVWDWLAGTLYVPRQKEELSFGLSGNEHREFDSIFALYFRPLLRLVTWPRRRALRKVKS